MPEKKTPERAGAVKRARGVNKAVKKAVRQKATKKAAKKTPAKKKGSAPTTQAGEYVREEMHRMHEGQRNAKNPKQAIAIGLSKARRDGVDVPQKKQSRSRRKA